MPKQLILDMQNQLLQVKTQVAIAIADQHLLLKKKKENEEKALEWRRKAELAVDKKQEDLARAAIERALTVDRLAQSFDQQIADRFNDDRMIARLTSLFGGLALLLATIGLYGVTSYTVVRRTPEIGIRMALGAERIRVVGMVMRGAMMQALLGLVIGAPIAILCVRYVKSQLYEITHVNPGIMVGAICILTVAAAVAGMIPARRAASINPVKALRVE